jgi:hypothetical protein
MSDVPDTLEDAIALIRHCRDAPVDEANAAFDRAMQRVIRDRNERIRTLSAGTAASDATLRKLNAILSLMASIEFPLAGFHRERLDQVAEQLQQVRPGPAAATATAPSPAPRPGPA